MFRNKVYNVTDLCNSILGGLVGITGEYCLMDYSNYFVVLRFSPLLNNKIIKVADLVNSVLGGLVSVTGQFLQNELKASILI